MKERSEKRKNMNGMQTTKAKYLQEMKPMLSKEFKIVTKYSFTPYQEKKKEEEPEVVPKGKKAPPKKKVAEP